MLARTVVVEQRKNSVEVPDASHKDCLPLFVYPPIVAQPTRDTSGDVGVEHHHVDPSDLRSAKPGRERRGTVLIPKPLDGVVRRHSGTLAQSILASPATYDEEGGRLWIRGAYSATRSQRSRSGAATAAFSPPPHSVDEVAAETVSPASADIGT